MYTSIEITFWGAKIVAIGWPAVLAAFLLGTGALLIRRF